MLAENYQKVLSAINEASRRSGRSSGEVTLIAVTKTVGIAEVRQAVSLGISDFGENRVQDAASKVGNMPAVRWHFIGHLQTNKAKDVLTAYHMIHSLDRLSLAEALQRCADRFDKTAEVLIQVNTSGEESKFGLEPDQLPGFLKKVSIFDRINIRGLMTMAPFVKDPENTRPYFRKLRQLRDENITSGLELPELSMGMTNDFTVAIEEGATMVRIGSALFG